MSNEQKPSTEPEKHAARVGDLHSCPVNTPFPHGGGPIEKPGSPQMVIGGSPAARMFDSAVCIGGTDYVMTGSSGVLIDGRYAARRTDRTFHGGKITTGFASVRIGPAGVPLTPEQTLALAMIQIRNSEFAKTEEGKAILARLEELYAAGKIKCEHLRSDVMGQHLNGTISLSSHKSMTIGKMAGLLVHEGTHATMNSKEVTIEEEERSFNNEIKYHQELAGGSGDKSYDEEMHKLKQKREGRVRQDEICHEYKRHGFHIGECYFGDPKNRPGGPL